MTGYLKRAIEINPKHAEALNYLGYSYADKGINLNEALSLINRALELKPESGYIMDSLGWVYYKLGNYDEALKILLKAVEKVKDDPVLYEHLGDVSNTMGFIEKTREYWQKSIEFHSKGDDEGLKERVEKKIKELGHGDREKL
jgi:tetratricopeptide (TPR) repeat protein